MIIEVYKIRNKYLRGDPWGHVREALEQVLLDIVQPVVRGGLARRLARELRVKVGDIFGGRNLGQEGRWDALVEHIVKVYVAEVRVRLDLLSIRWSGTQTESGHLHKKLFVTKKRYG